MNQVSLNGWLRGRREPSFRHGAHTQMCDLLPNPSNKPLYAYDDDDEDDDDDVVVDDDDDDDVVVDDDVVLVDVVCCFVVNNGNTHALLYDRYDHQNSVWIYFHMQVYIGLCESVFVQPIGLY